MISFLVRVGRLGTIKEIKWCNPAYIIPTANVSFSELIADSDTVLLDQIVESCNGQNFCHHHLPLKLKEHNIKVFLHLFVTGEDMLILGVDQQVSYLNKSSDEFKEIIYKFMSVVGKTFNGEDMPISEKVLFQIEKTQALNNELINTKRMLEKANAQLNILNLDLNNKLEKDPLTGLVSKYQYKTEIEEAISKHPGKLAVFTFIDIDNFKAVNDNYGHATGDNYLIEFAERLKRLSPENSIIMRIGGDEFGLFTYGLAQVDKEFIKMIWEELKTHLVSNPIEVDGVDLEIKISAGMAVYGRDTYDINELIEHADVAMYKAKDSGKNNFCIFGESEINSKKSQLTYNGK
ncbi:GGDEF domain-containing protein [Bacillaceae bacterium IKA-2]|nr:GGDEF domain-containing protein [Bacillaceae bacterium IKA-2]